MPNVGKGTPDKPSHGWSLYIVSVVMVIVSGIFVSLRIGIRLARKTTGVDDYITIIGLTSLIALSLTECMAVVNGYGMHNKDLTRPRLMQAFKWFYWAQIWYKIAVCLYKEAILFMYLRIFPNKRFRIMTYVMIGIVTASGIAFTLVTIFQCTPIAAFWDKSILKHEKSSHCFSSKAFWFSYAMINIFLDVMVLLLPAYEVMKLQLPWKERAGLIGVFSLGVFVCATSIIRTTTLNASSSSKDTAWGYIPATVWSVVEANTGMICACLPTLKQPLSQLFPKLFGSKKDSSSGNDYDYPLSSKNKKQRLGNLASGRKNSTDYHQWAMPDGTIVSPKQAAYSTRESEERIVDAGRGVRVTRDVNVEYGYDESSDSIPSTKERGVAM